MSQETQVDNPSYTLLELLRHRTPPLIVKHSVTKQMWWVVGHHFDGQSVIGWLNRPGSEQLTLLDRDERVWWFQCTVGPKE